MKFDIFGIDRPCVDFTVDLNTIPARNTGCLLNGTGWQGGGKVSTGVVAAARLGVACTLVGCVGDDLYGRFCRDDFVRHGFDVSQLHLAADHTSDLGVVVSERSSATRTILYRKGTAPMLAEEQVDWQALKKSQYLYIAQTTGLNAAAMDRASAWNIPIFIDADYYSDSLAESIPRTSYFVASEFVFDAMFPGKGTKELREMKPECREILRQGPRTVVFTFGGRGCVGCSREDGFFWIPAFRVPVRDTVGARDVFHGAFLEMLLKGMSPRECARRASGTSAIKCTFPSGRDGIPTEEILNHFLETGEILDETLCQRERFYESGIEYVRA